MRDMHPHWEATDALNDGDANVLVKQVRDGSAAHVAIVPTHVSRRPAAIVGILLVLGLGFVFVQGVSDLTGQIAKVTTVRITKDGTEPSTVTLAPGDTITWMNESETPQILESSTLCTASGECLETRTIFQGEEASYTIPDGVFPGDYIYLSQTSEQISGTITIQGGTSTDMSPSPGGTLALESLLRERFASGEPLSGLQAMRETGSAARPPRAETLEALASDPASSPVVAQLPRNPYTVGSSYERPTRETQEGSAGGAESRARAAVTGKKKPMRQPETGAGDFILVFAGLGAVTLLLVGVKRFCGRVMVGS